MKEIAEIVEPSQMAIYWGRLKARNYTKLYSKLNKIEGAITDGEFWSRSARHPAG